MEVSCARLILKFGGDGRLQNRCQLFVALELQDLLNRSEKLLIRARDKLLRLSPLNQDTVWFLVVYLLFTRPIPSQPPDDMCHMAHCKFANGQLLTSMLEANNL